MGARISMVTVICLLLSGCGLFGFWMNGDPAVGKNITPTRDYWILPGGDVKDRQRQWVACGGGVDGNKASGMAIPEEAHLSTKERFDAGWKRDRRLYTCMEDKGYRYIGRCQGSAAMDIPTCRKANLHNVPQVMIQGTARLKKVNTDRKKQTWLLDLMGRSNIP